MNTLPDEVKAKASKWALENAQIFGETMATNSALNRGFIAGWQEYAKAYAPVPDSDKVKKLKHALEYLMQGVSGLPPLTAIEGVLIPHYETAKAALEFVALAAPVPGKEEVDLDNDEWDNLINTHIEKMWGGLEMASVDYFIQTGKVNGSFRLRLLSLMKFYKWKVESKNAASTKQSNEDKTPVNFDPEKEVNSHTDGEYLEDYSDFKPSTSNPEPKALQQAAKEYADKKYGDHEDAIGHIDGVKDFLAGASFNSNNLFKQSKITKTV